MSAMATSQPDTEARTEVWRSLTQWCITRSLNQRLRGYEADANNPRTGAPYEHFSLIHARRWVRDQHRHLRANEARVLDLLLDNTWFSKSYGDFRRGWVTNSPAHTWTNQRYVAANLGISERTVRQALSDLEAKGYIWREDTWRNGHRGTADIIVPWFDDRFDTVRGNVRRLGVEAPGVQEFLSPVRDRRAQWSAQSIVPTEMIHNDSADAISAHV